MSNHYYPSISSMDVLTMRSVLTQLQDDPLWLERPDCPYEGPILEGLAALWDQVRPQRAAAVAAPREVVEGADKWTSLSADAATLFEELMALKTTISEEDVKEQLAFYKTATSLMEKLIALGERAANLKQISDFQARVISVFDNVLTPDQRTSAMKLLSAE
jgi:hypothetical protein